MYKLDVEKITDREISFDLILHPFYQTLKFFISQAFQVDLVFLKHFTLFLPSLAPQGDPAIHLIPPLHRTLPIPKTNTHWTDA